MRHEEFIEAVHSFDERIKKLKDSIKEVENEQAQMEESYVSECFERSGYKVGQKILGPRGRIFFVSGARLSFRTVVLNLNPAKKDGTMSKTVFIARGEPRIEIG